MGLLCLQFLQEYASRLPLFVHAASNINLHRVWGSWVLSSDAGCPKLPVRRVSQGYSIISSCMPECITGSHTDCSIHALTQSSNDKEDSPGDHQKYNHHKHPANASLLFGNSHTHTRTPAGETVCKTPAEKFNTYEYLITMPANKHIQCRSQRRGI